MGEPAALLWKRCEQWWPTNAEYWLLQQGHRFQLQPKPELQTGTLGCDCELYVTLISCQNPTPYASSTTVHVDEQNWGPRHGWWQWPWPGAPAGCTSVAVRAELRQECTPIPIHRPLGFPLAIFIVIIITSWPFEVIHPQPTNTRLNFLSESD